MITIHNSEWCSAINAVHCLHGYSAEHVERLYVVLAVMLSIVIDCYHLFCMVIDGCGCLSNVIHNYGWLLTVIRGYV